MFKFRVVDGLEKKSKEAVVREFALDRNTIQVEELINTNSISILALISCERNQGPGL